MHDPDAFYVLKDSPLNTVIDLVDRAVPLNWVDHMRVAMDAMIGLTSQPKLGSIAASLAGSEDQGIRTFEKSIGNSQMKSGVTISVLIIVLRGRCNEPFHFPRVGHAADDRREAIVWCSRRGRLYASMCSRRAGAVASGPFRPSPATQSTWRQS